MKKIGTSLLLIAAAWTVVFTGCDNSGEDYFDEQLVLQGFMVVDQPLSVRLIHTVKTGLYFDNSAVGVTGADVRIWTGEREFVLREDSALTGVYSLPADSHLVTTGTSYRIRVESGSSVLTAQTDSAAAALHIDSTNLQVWRDPVAMDSFVLGEFECYLQWNFDPRNEGYTIIVENIEPDWEDRPLRDENQQMSDLPLIIWPQRYETYLLMPPIALNFEGRHRVLVLSCDLPAYNYFFTNYPGDPQSNPQSNVSGGLGVFCAVGIDTAYFYVQKPADD
ncbi:DUF4249 family protein [candidate division KSB1 bacterium]|nr:MAG: DUF4249 family protein [candidate division KSB1 bacterium]